MRSCTQACEGVRGDHNLRGGSRWPFLNHMSASHPWHMLRDCNVKDPSYDKGFKIIGEGGRSAHAVCCLQCLNYRISRTYCQTLGRKWHLHFGMSFIYIFNFIMITGQLEMLKWRELANASVHALAWSHMFNGCAKSRHCLCGMAHMVPYCDGSYQVLLWGVCVALSKMMALQWNEWSLMSHCNTLWFSLARSILTSAYM